MKMREPLGTFLVQQFERNGEHDDTADSKIKFTIILSSWSFSANDLNSYTPTKFLVLWLAL